MDPDVVRLILVLLGILLVAGIYLWDRYKRAVPRSRFMKRTVSAPSRPDSSLGPEDAPPRRAEPTIEELPEDIPAMPLDASEERPPPAAEGRAGDALDPEPQDLGEWSAGATNQDPQATLELSFDAHGDSDYLSTEPALYDEVERLIVVVNLAARGAAFSGPAIDKACRAVNLVRGDMSIYHQHDPDSGKVLFSMASMVEPGSFPSGDMRGFSTPGLSIFTQLPGARDGVQIYDAMIATAQRLAGLLNAELHDEGHNKLTRQMQEHTREAIIEHRRRIKLARSRH